MIRRPPRSTLSSSSAASDVYKRQEGGLLDAVEEEGIGLIAFSPLAQGLLTDRYLDGIPEDSRAAKSWGFLKEEQVGPAIAKVKQLNEIAKEREQSMAQMAIAWLLKDPRVTSVLIGASSGAQFFNWATEIAPIRTDVTLGSFSSKW